MIDEEPEERAKEAPKDEKPEDKAKTPAKNTKETPKDEEKDTKGETGEYEDSEGNIVSPLKSKFANKLGDKLLSKEGDVTDKKTAKVIICVATEQDDPEIPRSGVFGYLADPKLSSTKILAIFACSSWKNYFRRWQRGW